MPTVLRLLNTVVRSAARQRSCTSTFRGHRSALLSTSWLGSPVTQCSPAQLLLQPSHSSRHCIHTTVRAATGETLQAQCADQLMNTAFSCQLSITLWSTHQCLSYDQVQQPLSRPSRPTSAASAERSHRNGKGAAPTPLVKAGIRMCCRECNVGFRTCVNA